MRELNDLIDSRQSTEKRRRETWLRKSDQRCTIEKLIPKVARIIYHR